MSTHRFPPDALPALAEFDPDKLVSLQLELDRTEPGSAERRKVQAEIAEFTQKFRISAEKLLRLERQLDLQRIVDLVDTQRMFEAGIIKDVVALLDADLTWTEMERFNQLIDKFIKAAAGKVAQALEALQNPHARGGGKGNRNSFTNY